MIESMDEPEERLDLVDENDTPIGAITRQEILSLEKNNRDFSRAVGVFVVNKQGQLWIPRRQEHKKIAPRGLDFSAGEHVGQGESYESAALRGLHEELSINPNSSRLRPVGNVRPFVDMPYFHAIFTYPTDVTPVYNQADYSGYEWLSPEEIVARLGKGDLAKEILLPSVQLVMQDRKNSGVTI